MPTYNPNAVSSIKDLFSKEGESLTKAGFEEPEYYDHEQAAEFQEFTGRMAVVVAKASDPVVL